jgi:hypothetical protein
MALLLVMYCLLFSQIKPGDDDFSSTNISKNNSIPIDVLENKITKNENTQIPLSENGVYFKYPYWMISQGSLYAYTPDNIISRIDKTKSILVNDIVEINGKIGKIEKPKYYLFDIIGQLIGTASYSDGEYYYYRYIYDDTRRLITVKGVNETSEKLVGTTQFTYSNNGSEVICSIDNGKKIVVVAENNDSNIFRYEYPAANGKQKNYISITEDNGFIISIISAFFTGSGKIENQRNVLYENGILKKYMEVFIKQNGNAETTIIKDFSYVDGKLKQIVVNDLRHLDQSRSIDITKYDKNGNWIMMLIKYKSGKTEKITRDITYY